MASCGKNVRKPRLRVGKCLETKDLKYIILNYGHKRKSRFVTKNKRTVSI